MTDNDWIPIESTIGCRRLVMAQAGIVSNVDIKLISAYRHGIFFIDGTGGDKAFTIFEGVATVSRINEKQIQKVVTRPVKPWP